MSPCGDASLYNIERNRHLALRESDFIKCYQSSNVCVKKGFYEVWCNSRSQSLRSINSFENKAEDSYNQSYWIKTEIKKNNHIEN